MRLIDADDLKNDVQIWLETANCKPLKELIDEQPTIEAVPVVHGVWERTRLAGEYLCSNCQSIEYARTGKSGESLWQFCPNCGAKMRAN